MEAPKKPAGALAMGAPAHDAPPVAPWFQDQDKLLKEVMRLAAQDRAFANRVAKAVGSLARKDARFKMNLKEASKAARRGAKATPYSAHVELLLGYAFLTSRSCLKAPEAGKKLSEIYRVAPETIVSRLKAARRVVDPADLEKGWIDSMPPVTDE